jgi:hypothetical protein
MRLSITCLILAGLSLGAVLADDPPPSSHSDEMLDAPGGHLIAIVLPGTARRIVETKQGYVKVVVEGWIRQEEAPKNAETAPPPPPAVPSAPMSAQSISGRIEVRLASKEVRYGAGARVMLLGNIAELEPRRVALASAYQSEVRDLQAEIAALQAAKHQALNSSENFTQATKSLDQTKSSLARKSQELGAIQDKYEKLGESLVQQFKVAEVDADPGGEYHLEGMAPGEYRLRAWFSDQGSDYRWYLPASVTAQKNTVLDLSGAKAGQDPFFQGP